VTVGGTRFEDVVQLADAPAGIGPIGGLCALLQHAGDRRAIALACDLPYLSSALLARLASEPSGAAVLAPRDPATGKWQPLFARYDAAVVLPVLRVAIDRGVRSFQDLLRELSVEELVLTTEEHAELRDWDTPEDVTR
jgi:molybdopterin-guanine dinucleotide biosynthesis protein A